MDDLRKTIEDLQKMFVIIENKNKFLQSTVQSLKEKNKILSDNIEQQKKSSEKISSENISLKNFSDFLTAILCTQNNNLSDTLKELKQLKISQKLSDEKIKNLNTVNELAYKKFAESQKELDNINSVFKDILSFYEFQEFSEDETIWNQGLKIITDVLGQDIDKIRDFEHRNFLLVIENNRLNQENKVLKKRLEKEYVTNGYETPLKDLKKKMEDLANLLTNEDDTDSDFLLLIRNLQNNILILFYWKNIIKIFTTK